MHSLELRPLSVAVCPLRSAKRGSSAIVLTLSWGTTTFAGLALKGGTCALPASAALRSGGEGAEPRPGGMSVLLCCWNDIECMTVLGNAGGKQPPVQLFSPVGDVDQPQPLPNSLFVAF